MKSVIIIHILKMLIVHTQHINKRQKKLVLVYNKTDIKVARGFK